MLQCDLYCSVIDLCSLACGGRRYLRRGSKPPLSLKLQSLKCSLKSMDGHSG